MSAITGSAESSVFLWQSPYHLMISYGAQFVSCMAISREYLEPYQNMIPEEKHFPLSSQLYGAGSGTQAFRGCCRLAGNRKSRKLAALCTVAVSFALSCNWSEQICRLAAENERHGP